jgi:hypothetical protein
MDILTSAPCSEHVLTAEAAETVDGIYRAVRFVADACPCEPMALSALGVAVCDYLRRAPPDVRGQVADKIIEVIRQDVRRSLS